MNYLRAIVAITFLFAAFTIPAALAVAAGVIIFRFLTH